MAKNELVDTDRGFKDLMARAQTLRGENYVKVGVLADSDRGGLHQTLPNGKAAPLTVAEIAAVNEYGTKDGKIPSRAAFRMTFDRMRAELSHDASKLIVAMIVDGTMTAAKALDILGLKLATAIRQTIVGGAEVPPTNAPSTKARKEAHGTTKGAKQRGWGVRTLVDTGRLVGAIAWARVMGGGKEEKAQYVAGGR